MKNVSIARGYAGLQAFIPQIKSRKPQPVNIQEVTMQAPLQIKPALVLSDGRVRTLAKRYARSARRAVRCG